MTCPYSEGCPTYKADSANCNEARGDPLCPEYLTSRQIDDTIRHKTRLAFLLITAGAIISATAFAVWLTRMLWP